MKYDMNGMGKYERHAMHMDKFKNTRVAGAPDVGDVGKGRHLGVDKDVRLVLGDAVVRDDDLFVAVDDKVAADVVAALVVELEVVVEAAEHAVARAHHDGQLAQVDVGKALFLDHVLARLGRRIQRLGREGHVDEQRRGIGEAAHARVVGRHQLGLPVFFVDQRLGQHRIGDLDRQDVLVDAQVDVVTVVDFDRIEPLDDLFDALHDEIIVRVQEVLDELMLLVVRKIRV